MYIVVANEKKIKELNHADLISIIIIHFHSD
jgi:hypothetical protein